jgi:hypothetical protein
MIVSWVPAQTRVVYVVHIKRPRHLPHAQTRISKAPKPSNRTVSTHMHHINYVGHAYHSPKTLCILVQYGAVTETMAAQSASRL